MNEDIISTNNLLTIKSDLRKWDKLSWEKLNNFMPIGKLTKEESEFLKKWDLYPSVFNVGCLHHLKMVYLPEFFLNNVLKLKGERFILNEEVTKNKILKLIKKAKEDLKGGIK